MEPESSIKQEQQIKDLEKIFDRRIDTEDLIYDVERTPTIWDTRLETYCDRKEKVNAWNSILTNYIPYFEERSVSVKNILVAIAERKWRSIRACYKREIKKRKTGNAPKKQYVYFKQMRFLDSIEGYDEATNIENNKAIYGIEDNDNSSTSVVAEAEQSMDENPPCIEPPKIKTRKRNRNEHIEYIPTIKPNYSARQNYAVETVDEDRQFLFSFLSEIRKVPVERKLKLRSEIISVIAAAQPQDVQPSPSYGGPLVTFHTPTHPSSTSHQTQSIQIPSASQHTAFSIHVNIPSQQVSPSRLPLLQTQTDEPCQPQNYQCHSPGSSSLSNESQRLEDSILP